MIEVKIRITADNMEEAEKARKYLERRLRNLRLDTPKKGNNPKYADNPKVLAYGDILIPEGKEHVPQRARRAARTTAPKPKKAAAPKTEKLERNRVGR